MLLVEGIQFLNVSFRFFARVEVPNITFFKQDPMPFNSDTESLHATTSVIGVEKLKVYCKVVWGLNLEPSF